MKTICVLCELSFESRTNYGICPKCCNELNLAEWDRLRSTIERYVRHGGKKCHITLSQWISTVQDFKGRCAFCRRLKPHDIEIIDPHKGITWDNIVPICEICKIYRKETFTASEVRVRGYLSSGIISMKEERLSLVLSEEGIVTEKENISWDAMETIMELGEK